MDFQMNERRMQSISTILSQAMQYPNVGGQKCKQYVLNLADLQSLGGDDRIRLNDLFSPAAWSSANLALFDIVRVIDTSAGLDVDLVVLQHHGVGAVLGFRGMDNPGFQ
jgi:hypothetical protein